MPEPRPSRLEDTRAAIEAAGSGLAPSHARALLLQAAGVAEAEIAAALDLPAEAVAPLLEVARAKLARIGGRHSARRGDAA